MSFFSFQDIICSITGIVFLVTILLTLELVQRVAAGGGPEGPAPDLDGLQADLEESKQQCVRLREEVDQAEAIFQVVVSPDPVTEDRIAMLEAQVEELRSGNAQQRDKLETSTSKRGRSARAVEGAERKEEKLRQDLSAARKELAEGGSGPRVGFIGERPGKAAILVECADDWIVAGRKKPGSSETEVLKRFTGSKPAREFYAWAGARKGRKEFFVLLVRPEGIEHYESLLPWLEKERFEVGWEPWASTKGALFPEP